jgi:hypothetical protein
MRTPQCWRPRSSGRFEDWCLQELGRRTDNASLVSAAGMLERATAEAWAIETLGALADDEPGRPGPTCVQVGEVGAGALGAELWQVRPSAR